MTGGKRLFDELEEFSQQGSQSAQKPEKDKESPGEASAAMPSEADKAEFWREIKPMKDELVFIRQTVAPDDKNWKTDLRSKGYPGSKDADPPEGSVRPDGL